MKSLFRKFLVITIFALLTQLIMSCGGNNSSVGKTDVPKAGPATPGTLVPPSQSSQFPPLASSIANAELEMLDGTKIKAADRKGKVILLNLWATWCGPCRSEMPHLVEMQDKFRDNGFQVLGLDVGDGNGNPESVEDIKKFAAKMKLNYELFRISNATVGEFYKLTNFEGVPQTLLVDREGRLRGVFLGGGPKVINSMKETVERVMAE